MKSLRKRFVNIIFASKGSVGRAARLSGHCHCRSSWRAVCRPLWSLQVCFVSIHFVYMFNLWSLSQLFQLDHLAPLQAVHGRVQPWHTNLPCETGPGGSGLSFVLDQEFLQLKARSQNRTWLQLSAKCSYTIFFSGHQPQCSTAWGFHTEGENDNFSLYPIFKGH